MKTNDMKRKLTLAKATLRQLTGQQLGSVDGALPIPTPSYGGRTTCRVTDCYCW